jgi:hypothetical protein
MYILIMVAFLSYGYTTTPPIAITQEFTSLKNCENAAKAIIIKSSNERVYEMKSSPYKYVCVPK